MVTIILENRSNTYLQKLFNQPELTSFHRNDCVKVLAKYSEKFHAYVVKERQLLRNLLTLRSLAPQEKEAIDFLHKNAKNEVEIIIPIEECIEDLSAIDE